jgi:H/ACA ribonucleoprotein complex subunit 3
LKTFIKKCFKCKRYTLKEICPICGDKTFNPHPPKFSPKDKYGFYKKELIGKT